MSHFFVATQQTGLQTLLPLNLPRPRPGPCGLGPSVCWAWPQCGAPPAGPTGRWCPPACPWHWLQNPAAPGPAQPATPSWTEESFSFRESGKAAGDASSGCRPSPPLQVGVNELRFVCQRRVMRERLRRPRWEYISILKCLRHRLQRERGRERGHVVWFIWGH